MITESLTEQGMFLAKAYGYEVSAANTILSPGKFEGEHVTTLVVYEWLMDGENYTENEDGVMTFTLSDKEREELGTPSNFYRLLVDENGFVHGNI